MRYGTTTRRRGPSAAWWMRSLYDEEEERQEGREGPGPFLRLLLLACEALYEKWQGDRAVSLHRPLLPGLSRPRRHAPLHLSRGGAGRCALSAGVSVHPRLGAAAGGAGLRAAEGPALVRAVRAVGDLRGPGRDPQRVHEHVRPLLLLLGPVLRRDGRVLQGGLHPHRLARRRGLHGDGAAHDDVRAAPPGPAAAASQAVRPGGAGRVPVRPGAGRLHPCALVPHHRHRHLGELRRGRARRGLSGLPRHDRRPHGLRPVPVHRPRPLDAAAPLRHDERERPRAGGQLRRLL